MSEAGHHTSPRLSGAWRRPAVLLALAILAVGGGAYLYFRPHATPPAPHEMGGAAIRVVSATVGKDDIDIALDALGTVTPLATVTVRPQISGQLMQVGFREGQTVHAGDFLAQIDPRPYQLQLEQSMGQLGRDQALLKDAQVNLTRYEKLLAEDSIARQQRDTQASLVKQYEGAIATDLAQVNNAKLNIAYCHITAPISGRIGLRQVDPGNYIQTGDAGGIVVITQMQPISVVFSVPQDDLPAILQRLRNGAVLTAEAYDRSRTTMLTSGRLSTTDNQIDAATGTIKLRAEFGNEDEILFPNQFVNVRLLVDTLHDAVTAPAAAIQRGAPGTFVYLIKDDGTVTVRPVKLGPSSGDHVAVLSGLANGDRVVVDGADKLREGIQVRGGQDNPDHQDGPRGSR
jgi:membrane fusion protein, multidrug efflux system